MTACSLTPNIILWFNPRQQLGTTQLITHSLPQWDGGYRMGRVKMGKNEKVSNLHFSRPFAGGVGRGAEKRLGLCEHCSAVRRTSLCYQHCFQHKSKHSPVPATVKRSLSTPAQTCTRCSHTGTTFLQLWLFVSLGWQQLSKKVGFGWVFKFGLVCLVYFLGKG